MARFTSVLELTEMAREIVFVLALHLWACSGSGRLLPKAVHRSARLDGAFGRNFTNFPHGYGLGFVGRRIKGQTTGDL
jgi:hypothetical protein